MVDVCWNDFFSLARDMVGSLRINALLHERRVRTGKNVRIRK